MDSAPDRYVFAREVTQEGMESCRGESEGEEEKINPHVLVSTRKRKVLSARVGRAEAGTIKCTESATKGGVPSSDKCNSEKPREMFVIGIVGPSCSLGA